MKEAVILVADQYQELEVWYPLLRLREAGWKVTVAGTEGKKQYQSKLGYGVKADTEVEEIRAEQYDALIIPGGWAPDFIRRNHAALDMVKSHMASGKTVAAICHGGWVLCSARVLEGRKCTSFAAIKDDMENAGGKWSDEEVVVDRNLVTARKPEDLPAFCKAIMELA